MNSGFTLIELLLVVGLILIIGVSVAPIGSNWYNLNNFDSVFSTTLSSLRKAQTYAIDNRSGAVWGVCHTGNIVRLFSGSCSAPDLKNDSIVPGGVTVSGLSTVTFSASHGEPSSPQTIVISSGNKTKTISINFLGGIDIN